MPLTLNQFLFLVLTFAAVVIAVFLVRFLAQLRRAAAEGEKTMVEVRKLVQNLNELDKIVKTRLTDLGEIMEASKKTAAQVSEATLFLTTRVIRPTSRYWPIVYPLVRFLWKKIRKRKERKDGG
jgi:hypothetical protein